MRYVTIGLAMLASSCTIIGGDDAGDPSGAQLGSLAAGNLYAGMSLYGIHDMPAPDGPLPSWMGDGTQKLWVTELAAINDVGWDSFHFDNHCFPNTGCGMFQRIKHAYGDKAELIARIDYRYHTNYSLPQNDTELASWKSLVSTRLFTSNDDTPITAFAHTLLLGNEVNLCVENNGAAGCAGNDRPARGRYLTTTPAWTAHVYNEMRTYIHTLTTPAHPDVNVMLESSAPGGYGNERYIHFVLQELCNLNADVDSIGLHAYGAGNGASAGDDGTYGFSAAVSQQLRAIDEACSGRYRMVPVVITEFSRGDNKLDSDSNFIFAAYQWLNTWNADSTHHGVSGATYFHGRPGNFANEDISSDTPNDHRTSRAAFQQAVAKKWSGKVGGNASAALPITNECSTGGGTLSFSNVPGIPNQVTGTFLTLWNQYGGDALKTFGYPISNARFETNSSGFTVCTQWFQRHRMELRNGVIEFGRLGADRAEEDYLQIGSAWNAAPARAGCVFANNHNVCDPFKATFQSTSLALIGLPMSEAFTYTDSHGTFVAQYFERARLENHTAQGDPNPGIQRGLLGNEAYWGVR